MKHPTRIHPTVPLLPQNIHLPRIAFRSKPLLLVKSPTDDLVLLQEDRLLSRKGNIILDYDFEYKSRPVRASSMSVNPSGAASIRRDRDLDVMTLARAYYQVRDLVMPLCETRPLRGELEIKVYDRKGLVDTLHNPKCISLPYQLCSDGLGLYRNTYRTSMRVYLEIHGVINQESSGETTGTK